MASTSEVVEAPWSVRSFMMRPWYTAPSAVAASRWLPVSAHAENVVDTDCAKGNARDNGHEGDRRLPEV
ncbi:hypothetical protein PI93_018350 [Pandoraea fibrosis]|uniref:Uncharacterized protein n=1 Tax=Pandoraea fibrosis TaxID=1891094 RepID=A0ABX6HU22_9BURK|nr:hypothetical protein [Pandoraea fibrosis]QHE92052.1 hypothetical protein PJ20_009650 [Pandoraea fibrosis]QHF14391.1 hypothetical protein PI93_018350 [Pandoraea fibrosis]